MEIVNFCLYLLDEKFNGVGLVVGGTCEVGAEALAKQVVTAKNAAAVEGRGERAFRKKVSGMGPLKSATCVAASR